MSNNSLLEKSINLLALSDNDEKIQILNKLKGINQTNLEIFQRIINYSNKEGSFFVNIFNSFKENGGRENDEYILNEKNIYCGTYRMYDLEDINLFNIKIENTSIYNDLSNGIEMFKVVELNVLKEYENGWKNYLMTEQIKLGNIETNISDNIDNKKHIFDMFIKYLKKSNEENINENELKQNNNYTIKIINKTHFFHNLKEFEFSMLSEGLFIEILINCKYIKNIYRRR